MDKKTIWIVNQYAGSPAHGMEYRHYYIAKELVNKGHEVYIISGSYSHLYTKLPVISGQFTFENIDGIEYCWVKLPEYQKSVSIKRVWSMLVFMFKLFFLPHKKFKAPHAIIVSSPSLFPIVNGYGWAKKYKARLIFEVRDIWPLSLSEVGNVSTNHPLILFMQWFENFAYKKADKVVSVLPNAFEHMQTQGLETHKFIHIPNGIDIAEVSNPKPFANEVLAIIPKNKFIVGYVGTIGMANALEYLIAAARSFQTNDNIQFLIVGNGGEKAHLKELAADLRNITFIDSIPKQQVQSLLSFFDVCYIGWRNEPLYRFGISANKIFDYMYAAKTIIHSVKASNDPIKEANCGISIEPENPEAIANAILKIYNMTDSERKQMGENARKYVIAKHSYDELANKYIEIIK